MTKIDKLESSVSLQSNNIYLSLQLIAEIMEGKECSFEFNQVSFAKIELMLMICKDKPPGNDFDGKLIKPITTLIAPMVAHIINQCSINIQSMQGKQVISKVVPIPKKKTTVF